MPCSRGLSLSGANLVLCSPSAQHRTAASSSDARTWGCAVQRCRLRSEPAGQLARLRSKGTCECAEVAILLMITCTGASRGRVTVPGQHARCDATSLPSRGHPPHPPVRRRTQHTVSLGFCLCFDGSCAVATMDSAAAGLAASAGAKSRPQVATGAGRLRRCCTSKVSLRGGGAHSRCRTAVSRGAGRAACNGTSTLAAARGQLECDMPRGVSLQQRVVHSLCKMSQQNPK